MPPPMRPTSGFEEIPHTADWAMKVWAEDLASLFAEAARGMNALQGIQQGPGPRLRRIFEHEAADDETLLVAFLSELIYLEEQEELTFDGFRIDLQSARLRAEMEGQSLASVQKPIKAVTFHNLQIVQTERGCEAVIVFDV